MATKFEPVEVITQNKRDSEFAKVKVATSSFVDQREDHVQAMLAGTIRCLIVYPTPFETTESCNFIKLLKLSEIVFYRNH